MNWDASGGGAFAVIPVEERGRVPDKIPLFRGHTAVVLDTDWYAYIATMLRLLKALMVLQEPIQRLAPGFWLG